MALNINNAAPMSGLSHLMAMKGRMGDTELVHMTKPEVDKLKSKGQITINPATGLPEHFMGGFFGGIGDMVKNIFKPKNLIPMAASMLGGAYGGQMFSSFSPLMGRAMGAGLGSFVGNKAVGRSWKDAGIAGLTTGGLTYGMGKLSSPTDDELQKILESERRTTSFEDMLNDSSSDPTTIDEYFANTQPQTYTPVTQTASQGALDKVTGDKLWGFGAKNSTWNLGNDFKPFDGSGFAGTGMTGSQLMAAATLAGEGTDMAQLSEDTDKYNRELEEALEKEKEEREEETNKYIPTDRSYTRTFGGGLSAQEALERALGTGTAAERRMFSPTVYAAAGGSLDTDGAFEGMITGEGHGMEDNIHMPITGGGIAAVSPTEYVVPADVMAMLGNGNPDNGANAMDDFIADFRKKQYGRSKQPPQTNAPKELQKLG
jgi:hypothetical protein